MKRCFCLFLFCHQIMTFKQLHFKRFKSYFCGQVRDNFVVIFTFSVWNLFNCITFNVIYHTLKEGYLSPTVSNLFDQVLESSASYQGIVSQLSVCPSLPTLWPWSCILWAFLLPHRVEGGKETMQGKGDFSFWFQWASVLAPLPDIKQAGLPVEPAPANFSSSSNGRFQLSSTGTPAGFHLRFTGTLDSFQGFSTAPCGQPPGNFCSFSTKQFLLVSCNMQYRGWTSPSRGYGHTFSSDI